MTSQKLLLGRLTRPFADVTLRYVTLRYVVTLSDIEEAAPDNSFIDLSGNEIEIEIE